MAPEQPDVPVRGTATSFRVIEGLRTLGGASITELADYLDMSKSGVHNHLHTLFKLGYVTRKEHTFYLGQRFLRLGERARNRIPLYRMGREVVDNLAETCGEPAGLIAHEHGQGVYLYYASSDSSIDTPNGGRRIPLVSSAGGKAILAHLPAEMREQILEETFAGDERTERSDVKKDLDDIRESAVAFETGGGQPDQRSVGVPIVTPEGTTAGAVCVDLTADGTKGSQLEESLSGYVISAAGRIERRLLQHVHS